MVKEEASRRRMCIETSKQGGLLILYHIRAPFTPEAIGNNFLCEVNPGFPMINSVIFHAEVHLIFFWPKYIGWSWKQCSSMVQNITTTWHISLSHASPRKVFFYWLMTGGQWELWLVGGGWGWGRGGLAGRRRFYIEMY
jgi:hypothetical protein